MRETHPKLHLQNKSIYSDIIFFLFSLSLQLYIFNILKAESRKCSVELFKIRKYTSGFLYYVNHDQQVVLGHCNVTQWTALSVISG